MKTAELGFAVGLFVVVSVVSQLTQRPITLNGGQGWDGQAYYAVAEQLAQGQWPSAAAPFVHRLGTPALAALLFPGNLLVGFTVVNLAGSFAALLLLVWWLRLYLADWWIRAVLVSLFLLTWHAPVRFLAYYPVYVDPWLFAVLIAGLIAVRRVEMSPSYGRFVVAGLITVVGVAFREVALLIPAALLAVHPVRQAWVVCGVGVLGIIGIHLVTDPTGSYSFARAALSAAYHKTPLTYVHSWFIAFGPLLLLPIVCWRDAREFLRVNRGLLVFLAGVAGLGYLGGTDTERLVYWSMPAVYVLAGRILEIHPHITRPPSFGLALLFLAQLVSARVFWLLPDVPSQAATPVPVLTVPANDFQYLDLYAFHGDKAVQVASMGGYLLVAIAGGWWLRRRSTSPTSSPAAPSACAAGSRSGRRRSTPENR